MATAKSCWINFWRVCKQLAGTQPGFGLRILGYKVGDQNLNVLEDSPETADAFLSVSEKLVAADVIVIASPVYFRSVPAQLKGLIDRGQCQWIRKYVDKRPLPASTSSHKTRRGVLIATGGSEREDFEGMIHTIKSFFDVYETEYWGELLLAGVDAVEIQEESATLRKAYQMGLQAVMEAWE